MTDDGDTRKELGKLIKKRGIIRTSVTNLLKKIEVLYLSEEDNGWELEEALEQVKVKEVKLKEVDDMVENVIDDLTELEKEVETSQEYMDKISIWKFRGQKKLNEKGKNAEVAIRVTTNETSELSDSDKLGIRLPKIAINKYYGDISQFQDFWNSYSTAIHNNNSLSKISKFNYLRSYLASSAYDAIAGFSLSEENYDAAIELLKERFGRTDLIINAHMKNLLYMKPVHKSNDILALRKLYDHVEIQIRSLKSLGIQTQTFGNLLCPIIIKAIPNDMALEFSRQNAKSTDFNVENLIIFLRTELEARERSNQFSSLTLPNNQKFDLTAKKSLDSKNNEDHFNRKFRKFDYKQNITPASATALNAVNDDSCIFCGVTDHKSDDCSKNNLHEKREILKKCGRCFLCFKKYHLSKSCKSKIECTFCHKRHRKALCEQVYSIEQKPLEEITISSVVPTKHKVVKKNARVFLQTVRAVASSKTTEVNVRCLLDGGSQRSFIHEELSKKLKLPVIGEETLNLHTFGRTDAIEVTRRRVRLTLQNPEDKLKLIEIELLESPEICSAAIECPNTELIGYAKKLEIKLSDISEESASSEIHVLIGSDYYWQVVSGRMKRLNTSIMLMDTIFGWSAQGSLANASLVKENLKVGVMSTIVFNEQDDDQLASNQLKAFWELDSLGITNEPNKRTISDQDALELFEKNLLFKDGRYEVRLPWKYEDIELPDNYENAKKRLNSLVGRFQKNRNLYDQYQAVISEYLTLDIIEEVKGVEVHEQSKNPIYYLPHQPVVRNDKETTKLRIVFDASSHSLGSPSLNDLLHPGPNLNPDLLNLLLKFRLNAIAMVSDIEKAFLQIMLSKEDRDATRFLWINEFPRKSDSVIEPKIYRMKRVLFGVTSSPFLLAAVIKEHLNKYSNEFPITCSALQNSMYVDDMISGASDTTEAFNMSVEAKQIFEDAKMSLRKWQTNSESLKKLWKQNSFDISQSETSLGNHCAPFKVLGLVWDPQKDIFRFDVTNLLEFINNCENTKRSIIKTSGRIFDPVGFLSPYIVRVKLIFQELWELGIKWDERLPENVQRKWIDWCDELPAINAINLQRCYFNEMKFIDVQEIQIHCFTDASEKAYGSVVYIRYVTSENEIKTSFIVSKSRIAPLKRLSVPRLELMGALIGARLINHFKGIFENFPGTVKNYFWTDSNIVLSWIRSSPAKWKPFVGNRVGEIQTISDPETWRYCPGPENPADMITRGKAVGDLHENSLWWSGPDWLILPQNFWPKQEERDVFKNKEIMKESRPCATQLSCAIQKFENVIEFHRYSSLKKILRIVAWVKRFINNTKTQLKNLGNLTAEELKEAEIYCIKTIQQQFYGDEIEDLKRKGEINKNSNIFSLCPYLDDLQLLRIKGRLQESAFDNNEKHPILLPEKSRYTELLIEMEHVRIMHGGTAATLNKIRKTYWIPKCHQSIKKVLNKCLVCKRYSAKPATQIIAPLPRNRILESSPFTVTGLDFAGPLHVKVGKEIEKVYITLFTCAVTRAIHLELVSNMTTKGFLLAFRRFTARRGNCKIIYSDNARTFKCAEKELVKMASILRDQEFQDHVTSEGISWKYIIERGAWWGGFYERLVQSVKVCLKKVLGRALLNFEEMTTLLTEIEMVINSRPITFTYNEVNEPQPLTPNDFLIGKASNLSLSTVHDLIASSNSDNLTRRKQYRQQCLKKLWLRWKQEYVLQLRTVHHMCNPRPHEIGKPLKINDIVLIEGKPKSKLLWTLGRISDVFVGRDGHIRSCAVYLGDKSTVRRPVQLVYPLELCNQNEHT